MLKSKYTLLQIQYCVRRASKKTLIRSQNSEKGELEFKFSIKFSYLPCFPEGSGGLRNKPIVIYQWKDTWACYYQHEYQVGASWNRYTRKQSQDKRFAHLPLCSKNKDNSLYQRFNPSQPSSSLWRDLSISFSKNQPPKSNSQFTASAFLSLSSTDDDHLVDVSKKFVAITTQLLPLIFFFFMFCVRFCFFISLLFLSLSMGLMNW